MEFNYEAEFWVLHLHRPTRQEAAIADTAYRVTAGDLLQEPSQATNQQERERPLSKGTRSGLFFSSRILMSR
jgi:hypothetical protein